MTSFKEEFMRSRELAEVGVEAELYRNDDGMLLVRQVPPPPVTITPEGDIDMGTVGEALEELPEALAAGASGLVQGATAATVGLPGDLAAIGNAAVDYFNQGDVAQALTILSDMSEQYGSGRVKQFFDENLPEVFSDKAKVAADVSRTYGEFGGIGTTAVAGARQVPPALRAIDRAGQRAQSRLDENVGTTLMSGIDPKRAADELTAGAGQVARAVLPDDDLKTILDFRAAEMQKKVGDRTQPSGQNPLFDVSESSYKANLPDQKETPVPRAPEGAKLPKGQRAAAVVSASDAIAARLAERMRPYLGTPAQYFYNTGPIIAKARELGVPEDVAREQLKKFALNYAATSPRTMTEQNLRNASLVSAKEARGISLTDIVGPGGTGINEKGYPMMIGPSGIHKILIDAKNAEGISFDTNPKPATFAENVMGNLQGVTVDTHAVRGALDAMNEVQPGSIPEGFILPKFREQYKNDPSSLDPATMIDDTLASQKIDGKSMQTEYAIFSDVYKLAAEKLGVTPAEAQSLGWFGSGDRTGLASELKTVVNLIDERVDVTAQALGRPKEEVFVDFMSGKIPLLSLGGLTLMEAGSMIEGETNGNL